MEWHLFESQDHRILSTQPEINGGSAEQPGFTHAKLADHMSDAGKSTLFAPNRFISTNCPALSTQLLSQQLIHQLRLGLSFGRLHHLSHKKAEDRRLAGTILLQLLGICRDYLVDNLFNR